MRIVSIVGARPQFVKAAAVSRELRTKHDEVLVHTGQHYDDNMSRVFFDELGIPKPDHNMGVGSDGHGSQTGRMLAGIERILLKTKPDCVLVYGDTNSTLAGALAAAKLHIPVAHMEAGLRSFNRKMPEEINRVLTDHVSSILFCPSRTAVSNLKREGVTKGVHLVGDVMHDALLFASRRATKKSAILRSLGLIQKEFLLATVHRAENTDDPNRLRAIMIALQELAEVEPVVFPVHPRTRKRLKSLGAVPKGKRFHLIDPVGYLDMVMLEQSARMILTDSGGIQKEACWLKVPCLTLRDETEWVETVAAGWNKLVGADSKKIVRAARFFRPSLRNPDLYGNGHSARLCLSLLSRWGGADAN